MVDIVSIEVGWNCYLNVVAIVSFRSGSNCTMESGSYRVE